MKNTVPGLHRGIQVWRELSNNRGDLSLEQIANRTGYPKASLLRMLHTLCDLHLIERNASGSYRATARITYFSESGPDFAKRIQQTLDNLANKLQVVVEWHEPEDYGLLQIQRAIPTNAEIVLQAKTGFYRLWNEEFDSLAVIGYAFCSNTPPNRQSLWKYTEQADRIPLTPGEFERTIQAAREKKIMQDPHYNVCGVKRIAAPVIRSGTLAGVLSLAFNFTPVIDTKIRGFIAPFQDAIKEIQRI
jgi:DNA-binding IclR family transcriptional regulator